MNDEVLTPQFYDILDNCLDELLQGEATVSDCLVRYPDYADLLEKELQVALLAANLKSPVMPEASVNRLEEQLQAQMLSAKPRNVILFNRVFLPISRAAAAVIIVFMFAFGSGAGVVAASADSIPGDTLYAVKRFWESVIVLLASVIGQFDEAMLHLAQTRFDEVLQLQAEGRLTQEALDDLYLAITETVNSADSSTAYSVNVFLIDTGDVLENEVQPVVVHLDYGQIIRMIESVVLEDGGLRVLPDGESPPGDLPPATEVLATATFAPTDTPTSTPEERATLEPTASTTPTQTPRIPPTSTRTPTVTPEPTSTNTPPPTPTLTWTPLPLPDGVSPTYTPLPAGSGGTGGTGATVQPTISPTFNWDREWRRQTQTAVYLTQTAGPPVTEESTP